MKQVLKEYDDSFDVGWKEDLERLAHLPDSKDTIPTETGPDHNLISRDLSDIISDVITVEDIKSSYPRLSALGFGCNDGDDDTKEFAKGEWDTVNNGPSGSNPYSTDGTFFYCCKEAINDSWEEIGSE